jgi:DNA polymerase
MVVGEAPGAAEDASGVPFVGRSGALLDGLIAQLRAPHLPSIYICNVVKCRPPANRPPSVTEAVACLPHLVEQVLIVRPKVLLTLGSTAARYLVGKPRPLSKLRRVVHTLHFGVDSYFPRIVASYHPAYALRNPRMRRTILADLIRASMLCREDSNSEGNSV